MGKLGGVYPVNGTPLGKVLYGKAVQSMVIDKAQKGELNRPVIIVVIMDGEVVGSLISPLNTYYVLSIP
jgi:hypothetical protein